MRLFYLCFLAFLTALLVATAPAFAQEPLPLDAYGDLPAIEDVAVSPSGRNIALVTTAAGERLIVLKGADLEVRDAIKIDDLKIRSMRFIGDEGLLVTRSRTQKLGRQFIQDKVELDQAFIISVDNTDLSGAIFADEASIDNSVYGSYGVRQVGSDYKAYFGGVKLALHSSDATYYWEHGRPSLFEVDLATMKTKRIDRPAGIRARKDWVVDANGELAATFNLHRETGEWYIKNRAGDKIATGNSPTGTAWMSGLSEDGSAVLYAERSEIDGPFRRYSVPLDGSSESLEFLEGINFDRLFWDRRTGHFLGYFEEGPEGEAVFINPANQKTANAVRKAFEGMDARIVEWTDDFRKFVVRTRGNGNSGIWFLVDLDAGDAKPIGYERPEITNEKVGPISTLSYTANDGLELDGILTTPPGREPVQLPLVMLPHGGPNSHDRETFHWMAQAFASRGYAVFQPNFRGSTNKDGAFVRMGNGQWGRAMQTDISDGFTALVDAGIVDADRACIMGASYGGYAALAGVTLQNGLYKCAVAVAPVADLSTLYEQDLRERGSRKTSRLSLLRQLGPKDGFKEVSPYRLAENADAPVLLIHGKDDTVVPFRQSEMMADALKDEGKPYEFVKLDGEDHWLSLATTRKQMLAEAVAFVQKHNPAD